MKYECIRSTEKLIVEMYYCSRKKIADEDSKKAKEIIKLILGYFELTSVFTKENHIDIVKQLYFSKDNICVVGIRCMAKKVFVHENTLCVYRKKYCEVIKLILNYVIR